MDSFSFLRRLFLKNIYWFQVDSWYLKCKAFVLLVHPMTASLSCSVGRWWPGTGLTASIWKKAPSHTCALSSSATVMASTVMSPPCPSPHPGKTPNVPRKCPGTFPASSTSRLILTLASDASFIPPDFNHICVFAGSTIISSSCVSVSCPIIWRWRWPGAWPQASWVDRPGP